MSDPWERKQFWPFDILPPEQRNSNQELEIRFLETAHERGYCPFMFGIGNFGATAQDRIAEILVRGRNRWEVSLSAADRRVLSAYVDDFRCSTDAVLGWLAEEDASRILEKIRPHLFAIPGNPSGFVLNEADD